MESNSKYKSLNYWNERYKNEDHFEWFGDYYKFKPILNKFINPNDSILSLGCGNSRMSEDMYNDNYKFIENIDYSPIIIDIMKEKYSHLKEMTWKVMDINKLNYEPNSFDCVLEKGTLDALLVDEKDPWNMSEESSIKIDKILQRVETIMTNNFEFLN
jgi:EEF1A lysine methyltransferase 4